MNFPNESGGNSQDIKAEAILTGTAGQRRQMSPSPLRNPRKRQILPADPPPDLSPPEPLVTEDNWHCPSCGLPCWRCHSTAGAPPDLPRLHKEASTPQSMEPPSVPASAISYTSTTLTKKRKRSEEAGLIYIGPRDKGFKQHVLDAFPVNLEASEASDVAQHSIFDIKSPNPPSRVFIHREPEDLNEIIHDFKQYELRGCNENALISVCSDSIIQRDRFIANNLSDNTQVIKSVRKDKWKPGKQGPPVPGNKYTYDWDIEPDTTYAVSINMFSAEDRRKLLQIESKQEWLGDDDAVCPYLTVEYKSGEKGGKQSHARYQTVAAAMLWLYQLKRILDALDKPLDSVRHYLITIVDAAYTISIAGLNSGGYEIATLVEGNLKKMNELEEYIRWSNAIHSWGLGTHATSFKKNIKQLLQHEQSQSPLATPEPTDPAGNHSAATPLCSDKGDKGE